MLVAQVECDHVQAKKRPFIKTTWSGEHQLPHNSPAHCHNGLLQIKATWRALGGWLQVNWPTPFALWRRSSRRFNLVAS